MKRILILGISLVMPFMLISQANYKAIVDKAIDADNDRLVTIFKDLHTNPELGFAEVRTSGIVADNLKKLGYTVTTGIAKTGVVGVMKNGEGSIVMYRADMDCNAIKETTGVAWASDKIAKKEDGSETPVMHACGHDAHTTWMLGVAKFMAENKNLWKGTAIFVAQPAEELGLGAEAMINDKMYEKASIPEPDYLFGIHTAPLAVGMVAAASGIRMAGVDQIDVIFHGIGGHGSTPNFTKDPIIMAANAINQYQAIVSRGIDPKHAAVITVGSVQAGSDNNVIPSSALLKLNLRWFSEDDRKTMIDGITRINEGIAYAYNLPKELQPTMVRKGWAYPLDNNKQVTETVRAAISSSISDPRYLLDENNLPSVMGSEDFHHLVVHNSKKDYCYINVGIAEPERFKKAFAKKTLPFNAHNGDFEVDLSAVPFGAKIGTLSMLAIFNQAEATKGGKEKKK